MLTLTCRRSVNVEVSDLSFKFNLHTGYDQQSSRAYVRNEARRVRKRLLKIKQLLADGQTPDERVTDATDALMQSVHLTLPEGGSDLGPDEFLHIMNEQIGNADAPATQWADPKRKSASRSLDPLERSASPILIFDLKGAHLDWRNSAPDPTVASRLDVRVKDLTILDQLPSSTWRTFLTEMLPESIYQPIDPDSQMLRIRLDTFKTASGSSEVELRAKLSPLRLHVDQDALDFLKVFFIFNASQEPASEQSKSAETFISESDWASEKRRR